MVTMIAENLRLQAAREGKAPWKKWGPYLSERQWGTVREDYSDNGDAWSYFSHDQARSRAYRWGEDGIGGICDNKQRLCFALALWNGRDPIIKERLFGLTNAEGNHGEDVKEYYFYLDNTPSHSYMKYLYKYPQASYPYADLAETNRRRTRHEMEYELLDTGVFDEDRYFDVFVEYALAAPEDILIKITVANRGPEAALVHMLPHLWCRNTWSWSEGAPRPLLEQGQSPEGMRLIAASHPTLGERFLACEGEPTLLFTENETNNERLFGTPNRTPYVKDGINNYLVHGDTAAVNPEMAGTKAAAHYQVTVPPGGEQVIRLRLLDRHPEAAAFGPEFDATYAARLREADELYAAITPPALTEDQARVLRQALAGLLWSKQYYYFDADIWLEEHGADPFQPGSRRIRNKEWFHMVNDDVISMPDKWEYPWYAAWDLAFHTVTLATVGLDFAKEQLALMLQEIYLHPNGQIPAYEWNFSDVNPPVHAWATISVYTAEKEQRGQGDLDFLKNAFSKLMLNFTWWVNRKDRFGKNIFEGGFLGLDNIGVFDRNAPLPTGGYLEQADGTAWMAFYCQMMMQIALELDAHDPSYEPLVLKFIEHFLWIGAAMNRPGKESMWDEEDGFYYDLLRLPDGSAQRLKVRSMVGLLPFCAVSLFEPHMRDWVPKATAKFRKRLKRMPKLLDCIHPTGTGCRGEGKRSIFSLLDPIKIRRVLTHMLDENEFLSPYGLRALSRYHLDHPFVFTVHGEEYRVQYLPAESDSGLFGGNSNWRGPIWFPVNILIIRALLAYYLYHGDRFKIECPTGSGNLMNLFEVARELANRLSRIFLRDETGRRPVYGGTEKFQSDPHWRDYILFYEYFHGDNGAGLGASHQTGWTAIVAKLLRIFAHYDAQDYLKRSTVGPVLLQ